MDKVQRISKEVEGDGRTDSATGSVDESTKYTKDAIPKSRRAVGLFIKNQIQKGSELTITAFLHAKKRSEQRGLINRLIQGRKIIREEEALLLVELFGGTIDFWITLEHKILANPNISVPSSFPPNEVSGSDRRFMSDTSSEFGAASGSEEALSGKFLVLGEGKDRSLIPTHLPPEVISDLYQRWLNRPQEGVDLAPSAPSKD